MGWDGKGGGGMGKLNAKQDYTAFLHRALPLFHLCLPHFNTFVNAVTCIIYRINISGFDLVYKMFIYKEEILGT